MSTALSLPTASVSVSAQASAAGAGDGYIAIITPVVTLDDGVPRLYASGKAALAAHGYSPGISYGAMHAEVTRRPFLIVPVPIATAGVLSAVDDTGAPTGTSVVTVSSTADGPLDVLDWTLTVVTGGTIGTAGIVLSLTCDGGAVTKTIRLGTANTYAVPDLNFTIAFAAGTMVATEYFAGTSTGPMWDSSGLTLAKAGLAAAQYPTRSWMIDGLLDDTAAGLVVTAVEAYASANERFTRARGTNEDLVESTWALDAAAKAADLAAVNSTDGRLSLSFGFRRRVCPLTSWAFRRPASWAASLREYARDADVHTTTWYRARGPLTGWFTIDTDSEHDERVDGGALAGRFTCFTTLANGTGVYIAKDLTRAADDSPLLLWSNGSVTDVVCNTIQRETTRLLGASVIKNADNTIDAQQAVDLEEGINAALKSAVLTEVVPGQGPRVSACRAVVSRDDDLSGPGATLTWTTSVNLRGVISQVTTLVRVF